MPGGVSKFESITEVSGQNFQETLQAFSIDVPMWRQLKQDRAEFAFKADYSIYKLVERIFTVPEFFHVGNQPAGFDGKNKIIRCLIYPLLNGSFTGQPVKTVVQFNA